MEFVRAEDVEPGIRVVVLARPEKLNALNAGMKSEFLDALNEAESDSSVRVVIVRGEGRAFSVGNDFSGYGSSQHSSTSQDQGRIDADVEKYLQIWNLDKPVIAQVHGHCLGLATLLCICCDLVYVADDCRVGWPVLPIGGGLLSPGWAWLVGAHKAKEMSFQPGATFTGAEAARLGWANEAVPPDELDERVRQVARNVRRVPSEILRVKKRAVNQVFDGMGFPASLRLGAAWDALLHPAPEVGPLRERIRNDGIREAHAWYEQQDMI